MQSVKIRILDGQQIDLFSNDNQYQGYIKMNQGELELKGNSQIRIQNGNDLVFQGTTSSIKGIGSTLLKIGVSGDTVSLRESGVTYQLPSINTIEDVDLTDIQIDNVLKWNGSSFVPYNINDDYWKKTDLSSTSGQSYIGVTPISDIGTNTTVQEQLEKLKQYQDSLVQGLDYKDSVRVQTTSGEENIDLTTPPTVIDNVTLQEGDRVLVKNQTTNPEQNGIYVFSGGQLIRQTDQDSDDDVSPGLYVFVEEGTTNGGTSWVLSTTGPISLGTTPLTFTMFSKIGDYEGQNVGTGLGVFKEKSGNLFIFRTLSQGSSKVSVVLDSDTIKFDVVENQLSLNNLSGVLNVTKGGTGLNSVLSNRLLWTTDLNTFTQIGLDSNTLEVSGGNLKVKINDLGNDVNTIWSQNKIIDYVNTSLSNHNHDDRYYTETELSTQGSGQQVSFGNITNYQIQRKVVQLTSQITQDSTWSLPDSLSYTPGQNNLIVFVDGIKRIQDTGGITFDYQETSSTQITFHFDIPQGSIIEIYKLPLPSEV